MVSILQNGDSVFHRWIYTGIDNIMRKKKYKLTKKDWMMLLDFWPLSIVTPAMLILIMIGPMIMQ